MAALSKTDASVRRQAGDTRREAAELRLAARRISLESRRRRHECLLSYARASRIRAQPLLSPWSDLTWRRPDDELAQVLVSVPNVR